MCSYDSSLTSKVHKAIALHLKTGTPFKPIVVYETLKNDPILEDVEFNDFDWAVKSLCGWKFFDKVKNENRFILTWEGLGFAKRQGWL